MPPGWHQGKAWLILTGGFGITSSTHNRAKDHMLGLSHKDNMKKYVVYLLIALLKNSLKEKEKRRWKNPKASVFPKVHGVWMVNYLPLAAWPGALPWTLGQLLNWPSKRNGIPMVLWSNGQFEIMSLFFPPRTCWVWYLCSEEIYC